MTSWWPRAPRPAATPVRSRRCPSSPRSSMPSATACPSWRPAASSTAGAWPPRSSLGADGVWVGTRFIATPEARGVLGYKEKLLASREDQTTVSRAYSGKTMRVVRNEYTDYYDAHPEELKKFPEQLGIAYGNGSDAPRRRLLHRRRRRGQGVLPGRAGRGCDLRARAGRRAGAPLRRRGRGASSTACPPCGERSSRAANRHRRAATARSVGNPMASPRSEPRVAIVTGANHGIGAATAKALAAQGTAVLCAYFRNERQGGLDDPSLPAAYRATRMARADFVVESIRASGGRAAAVEADLSDAERGARRSSTSPRREFGPVQILVNNASGWIADTFVPAATDRFGRAQSPLTARTLDQVFAVDARAAALLIAEYRAPARGAAGAMGSHHRAHVGRGRRLPRGGLLRCREGGPGQLHAQRGHRAGPLRRHRQRRPPPHHRHGLDRPESSRRSPAHRAAGWPRPRRWRR